jgi:hypothetical protein
MGAAIEEEAEREGSTERVQAFRDRRANHVRVDVYLPPKEARALDAYREEGEPRLQAIVRLIRETLIEGRRKR